MYIVAPNVCSCTLDCSASTMPVKKPVSRTMPSDLTPISSICWTTVLEVEGAREGEAERSAGQGEVLLDGLDLRLGGSEKRSEKGGQSRGLGGRGG